MCIDTCTDMCIDMCIDMCMNKCIDTCIDMCIDMCLDMYMGMRIDMCIDMWIGTCIEMHADMGQISFLELDRLACGAAPSPDLDQPTCVQTEMFVDMRVDHAPFTRHGKKLESLSGRGFSHL